MWMPAFQWMCQRSGGGDFLVIRATGTDAYNPYIQQLCPNENSVATLIIPNASCGKRSGRGELLCRTLKQSGLQAATSRTTSTSGQARRCSPTLNTLITQGVPIGGTSAGMNVLSQFVYTALASQGATSSQSLADPYNRYITLGQNFVNIGILQGMIDDPHFVTRDRMGRDLAFICQIYNNGWSNAPRDIAIDEQTALLLDSTDTARL